MHMSLIPKYFKSILGENISFNFARGIFKTAILTNKMILQYYLRK